MVRAVPEVVQPPHAKPTIMAITAPMIRPQIPYLTFAAVTGCIDGTVANSPHLSNLSHGIIKDILALIYNIKPCKHLQTKPVKCFS
jgi:hypothetical protein